MLMDFFVKFRDLLFKNSDLFSRIFVEGEKIIKLCIEDGIIYLDSISDEVLQFKEFWGENLPRETRHELS